MHLGEKEIDKERERIQREGQRETERERQGERERETESERERELSDQINGKEQSKQTNIHKTNKDENRKEIGWAAGDSGAMAFMPTKKLRGDRVQHCSWPLQHRGFSSSWWMLTAHMYYLGPSVNIFFDMKQIMVSK